jgi:site-specific recombinase XerD
MDSTHPIAPFVQAFFLKFLAAQRGLSPNTILSYKDALKLLLRFAVGQRGKPTDKLTIEDFDEKLVLGFLDHLESTRGNCADTRNNRLAALRAFFRYVADREPTVLARCQQICAIPLKRTGHKTIVYLDDAEMRALLDSIDQDSQTGRRDYALVLFLYNSGARVQEIVDLRIEDLRFETPCQVKLTGKGRKERVCPLWPETVQALQKYLNQRQPKTPNTPQVFLNAKGEAITRFGIRHVVRKYAVKASEECPSLKSKKVSPHTLRHTTAIHLLQSGNDISVVKDWMGHADINTTHGYVEIDLKMKQKALDACAPPTLKTRTKRQKWRNSGILEWLDDLSTEASIMCSTSPRPALARD